jgi:rare lipoprotein A
LRPRLRRVGPLHVAAGALITTTSLGGTALAVAQADPQGGPVPMAVRDASLHFGQRLEATGRLTPGDAGERVALQLQPRGAAWTTIAEALVSANGDYDVAARPRTSGAVRVVTVPAGTVASAASARSSTAQTVTVAAKIATHGHGVDVLAGHRGRLHGRVLPGVAGRTVRVQARRHGHWRTLGSTHTRTGGRFTVAFRGRRIGSSALRVAFAGDGANAGARHKSGRLNVYRASLASWYSLNGGALACGGTMTSATMGVANKSLPCGTMVSFRYRGRTVRVPVIDRGPYSGAREWDLSGATARALGFGGVGTVWSTK